MCAMLCFVLVQLNGHFEQCISGNNNCWRDNVYGCVYYSEKR